MDLEFYEPEIACEPEVAHSVNRELNLAWQIVEETGANLFLTGKAGTGKTTFLKKLRENSPKNMVVLAPTGVAAINAGGSTIHSFFQLPFSIYIPGVGFAKDDKRHLNVNVTKKRIISSLSLLVIDEISMVRPDILDAIDSILRRLKNSSKPFGGVQLLLIGDLRQLSPVVTNEEWELLKDSYSTPYFFESKALQKAGYQTVELSMVYRQQDKGFVNLLNRVRTGNLDLASLNEINRRVDTSVAHREMDGYIRLTTHNRRADAINNLHLNKIADPVFTFEAIIDGNFPDSAFPAEKFLHLKKGAQVMFIKNDTGDFQERKFYNGLIGTITDISEDKILVTPLNCNESIEVEPMEWENTQYTVNEQNKSIEQETIGTFKQYPLRLAWAITIHKSQGLTFEKAIIDTSYAFAAGQTYVALSRCRSLEGMILESPLSPHSVIIDQNINGFTQYCEANAPNVQYVEQLKNIYLAQLLAELFDFQPLMISYTDFFKAALDYLVPLYPDLESQLESFRKIIERDIYQVSRKFLASWKVDDIPHLLKDGNSDLNARIKKGCAYFLEILEKLLRFLQNMPMKIPNQTYAKRLNSLAESLENILIIKIGILEILTEKDFSAKQYLEASSKASLAQPKHFIRFKSIPVVGSKSKILGKIEDLYHIEEELEDYWKREQGKQTSRPLSKRGDRKPRSPQKPKGYSTFETLRLFREGKSVTEIALERNLKEATIGSHIADLISMDRIKLEEIISRDMIDNYDRLKKENPEDDYATFKQKLLEAYPQDYPDYILPICRRFSSLNVPKNENKDED